MKILVNQILIITKTHITIQIIKAVVPAIIIVTTTLIIEAKDPTIVLQTTEIQIIILNILKENLTIPQIIRDQASKNKFIKNKLVLIQKKIIIHLPPLLFLIIKIFLIFPKVNQLSNLIKLTLISIMLGL